MILQLNPPLELETPKGKGLAWFLIDYGVEHHLMWTVVIHETREIWTFPNPDVRGTENITMGRKNYSDLVPPKPLIYPSTPSIPSCWPTTTSLDQTTHLAAKVAIVST